MRLRQFTRFEETVALDAHHHVRAVFPQSALTRIDKPSRRGPETSAVWTHSTQKSLLVQSDTHILVMIFNRDVCVFFVLIVGGVCGMSA